MYIHPELGQRLAHAKIEEEQFRTQRARALRPRVAGWVLTRRYGRHPRAQVGCPDAGGSR